MRGWSWLESENHKYQEGITRTCGGDPDLLDEKKSLVEYYPHMRGWSCLNCQINLSSLVLPAHAGVILEFIN